MKSRNKVIKASIMLFAFIVVGIGTFGCGASGGGGSTIPEKTTITYSISPDKSSYSASETVTITATVSGPAKDTLGVAWSSKFVGGTSTLPTETDTTYEIVTGGSGFDLTVTAEPNESLTVNGVSLYEGTATYAIKVL